MSYNLQSLITILHQLLNPQQTRWYVTHKKNLHPLLQKAASLNEILEKHSGFKIESLESRIRDATEKAEDIIESIMVDQVLLRPGGKFFIFPTPNLQQVIEEFDSATEQLVEILEGKTKILTASSSSGAALLYDPPSFMNHLVGVDEDLELLKCWLLGGPDERRLEILSIIGVGGIGKTALARNLYEDPLFMCHFDILCWNKIPFCRPNEKLSNEIIEQADTKENEDSVYKCLYGKKYLLVIDDMCNTDYWDVIGKFFPDNHNGSRIVLTTRDSDVANYIGKESFVLEVNMIQDSESWKLLCQIVFGEEHCPDIALEETGRKIAGYCGGLPLAVKVIGGLLSKVERSIDVWDHIANDVSAETDDDQFSNVLASSYHHLPTHLKSCFLYMGAFPKGYEIRGSTLLYMLMAEGFIKSTGDKSMEEDAEGYLKALVERNLLLVTKKKFNGKALSYGMHDLLRDFCRRKGDEEKFVHVKDERGEVTTLRRVSVHSSTSYRMEYDVDAMSLARSFICTVVGMPPEILTPVFLVLRLVRVLDVIDIQFEEFPREILRLVNLRYLAFCCTSGTNIPGEISRLLNLQTLIGEIHGGSTPTEIWEMPELRHLKLDTIIYNEEGYMKQKMQEKLLQTTSTVRINPSVIRKGFLETIPDIRELGIYWVDLPCSEEEEVDLRHLHKLQTLKCRSNLNTDGCRFLPTLRYPSTLRKLTLVECVIFPRVLTTLCALPNLEVLKIFQCEFENGVFEATEADVFRSLEKLSLCGMSNLVHWRADATNFPTLWKLVITDCPLLEEIPSGIGDISTLQIIEVKNCSPSFEASADQMRKLRLIQLITSYYEIENDSD